MTSYVIRRARLARKFGMALIVAGLAAIAWLVAAFFNPVVPTLPSIETLAPLHRAPWMPNPSMLLFSLAGLAMIWLGASIIGRQKAIFEADRRETEDRLRRVREYGGEGRFEPYIGSPITFENDKEPS
jgi:hypothetical protein